MRTTKRILIFVLTLLCFVVINVSASAAPEFMITDISYEKTFANCPYDFSDPNQNLEWGNLGQSVFYDDEDGVMCVGFDETSTLGTQMGVYIKILDNFTSDDFGTYNISYRTKLNRDLYSDFALAPNVYRGNSLMGGRKKRDADIWNEVSGTITISESNADKFLDKPLYLFLYYSQNQYVSEVFSDKNFKVYIDDIAITKAADPAILYEGTYIISADVLSKTAETLGGLEVTAAEFDNSGYLISEKIIGSFEYSGKTKVKMPFVTDHDINDGYLRIFVTDNSGAKLSNGARLPKFYKNGVNLMPNSSFEGELEGWNIKNGSGSIDTSRYYDSTPSLKIVSDDAQADVSSVNLYELIKEYGAGTYLIECNVYSNEKIDISASLAGKSASETVEGGDWTYYAVCIDVSDADIIGTNASAPLTLKITSKKPVSVNVDNAGIIKVLDYKI